DRDVHADDFSLAKWSRYAGELRAARTLDDVVRAGRRWGFTWDKPEVPHCDLCVAGMAVWSYAIETSPPLACAEGRTVGLPAHDTRGRDVFGSGLEALTRMV